MKSKEFLIISPEIPYPPRRNGLSLRYFPIIEHLTKKYTVDLVILERNEQPKAEWIEKIRPMFRNLLVKSKDFTKPSSLSKKLISVLNTLNPFGLPANLYCYDAKENCAEIEKLLNSYNYERVIFITLINGHELSLLTNKISKNQLFIDAIDSSILHFKRSQNMKRLDIRLTYNKLVRWEAKMINQASRATYISRTDLQAIKPLINSATNLTVSPNGVFLPGFHQKNLALKSLAIGFLGNMSYAPNIRGALFGHNVYKALKKIHPSLRYYIIGRDPAPEISALANDKDVIVTGTVDDIWVYINSIDVFILNLFSGAGQQNKVLEVMYAGKPVVANALSNAGIQATHGEAIMISNDIEHCISITSQLLNDEQLRRNIGQQASQFIEETYSWKTILLQYSKLMTEN